MMYTRRTATYLLTIAMLATTRAARLHTGSHDPAAGPAGPWSGRGARLGPIRSTWLWWVLKRLLGSSAHSVLRLASLPRLSSMRRPHTPVACEPLVTDVERQDEEHAYAEAGLPSRIARRVRTGPVAESAEVHHASRTASIAGSDVSPTGSGCVAPPTAVWGHGLSSRPEVDQRSGMTVSDVWTWLVAESVLSCDGLQHALQHDDSPALASVGGLSERPSSVRLTRMGALLDWRRRAGATIWSLCGISLPQSSIGPAAGCKPEPIQPATSTGSEGVGRMPRTGIDWDIFQSSRDTERFLAAWNQVRWSPIV